ncbi:hypothetical protein DFH06DRAFT_1465425 [Mycena polygramma]|nr:hypothetical protein DFH06DRAFT_1465425 [Mycena polygramma]
MDDDALSIAVHPSTSTPMDTPNMQNGFVDAHDAHAGLTHPPHLLPSLPPLPSVPAAKVLSAPEFAAMHMRHTLAHAPDGVLFPFLHGLEGDNEAQNTFFAGTARSQRHEPGARERGKRERAGAPRFRGLVWVVVEEDLDVHVASPAFAGAAHAGMDDQDQDHEFDDDEDESEEESEEDELELEMEVDSGPVPGVSIASGGDEHQQEQDHDAGKHMHPVHLRTGGLPLGTPSIMDGSDDSERFFTPPTGDADVQMDMTVSMDVEGSLPSATPTSASASGSDTSASSYSAPSLIDSGATAQNGSALPPPSEPDVQNPMLASVVKEAQGQNQQNEGEQNESLEPGEQNETKAEEQQEQEEWHPTRPPLLTCTFRARELVRRVGEVPQRPHLMHAPALRPAASPAPGAGATTEGGETTEGNEEKEEEWEFRPARVPDGISLRNFGIQVPIYATLSDIVLYSPRGMSSPGLHALAARFVSAVGRKRRERCAALGIDPSIPSPDAPLEYNVFVLDADARALRDVVPELMMRVFDGSERRGVGVGLPKGVEESMDVDGEDVPPVDPHTNPSDAPVAVPIDPHADATTAPNTVDFGQRERDEMRELTRASEILTVFPKHTPLPGSPTSAPATPDEPETEREDLSNTTTATHWRPAVGQVFLGNSGDVPLGGGHSGDEDPFAFEGTNAPRDGMGYDVCVECHEMAPFPSLAHLRAAEDHLAMLDGMWDERVRALGGGGAGRVRPPPNATAVIHLPFPSAPTNTAQTMNALLPVIAFLERCLRPLTPPSPNNSSTSSLTNSGPATPSGARRWSTFPAAVSPASFFPSPPAPPGTAPRTRSLTSPSSAASPAPTPGPPPRTRPLKILIYSSDGYTESSPLALSLLMAVRRLSLPEAYLELQVAKRRSFFVYPGELGLLRRVEARIGGGEVFAPARLGRRMSGAGASTGSLGSAGGARIAGAVAAAEAEASGPQPFAGGGRPSAKSVSFAPGAVVSPAVVVPSQGSAVTRAGRPRARTSPWLPSFGDHQSWFNDPRFDGSFPSRVLPFLYLGNLNHASNAYMLHALGITHVVSVGECALVPPPGQCTSASGDACTSPACRANHGNAHFIPGKGPGNQGSLWIEEREGRIKVLDIKGVCDDGIDTLEPELEPICEWIEKARQEGGQVLVHCRVGVSRSATVTIAYVMKHLSLPLVDAYLIVRSRRLSVLIQPNMRLLYNLCGWEIKLAKERARGDERQLRKELARTLTWPYLSKEVHALNEKYLH